MLSDGFVASPPACKALEDALRGDRLSEKYRWTLWRDGDAVKAVIAAGWVPANEYRDHLGDQRVEHAVALGAALNERDAALAVIAEVREALAPGRPLYASLGAARAALEKVSD